MTETTGTVKSEIELTKQTLRSLNKALNLYSQVLDYFIPWKSYEQMVKDLNRFRDDYSVESAELIDEVKSLLMTAQDQYFAATLEIYGWCGGTVHLLTSYVKLFAGKNSKTYEAQRSPLLIHVLDNGVNKIRNGQRHLEQCSINFDSVSGKLTALQGRLLGEFDTQDKYFKDRFDKLRAKASGGAASSVLYGPFGLIISYSDAAGIVDGKLILELKEQFDKVKNFFYELKTDIVETCEIIDDTNEKLRDELLNIEDLKMKTEGTEGLNLDEFDELREMIFASGNILISRCKKYQKHHGKKN